MVLKFKILFIIVFIYILQLLTMNHVSLYRKMDYLLKKKNKRFSDKFKIIYLHNII